ncbi:hypothetical protein ES703_65204 [subsurface metagenome]
MDHICEICGRKFKSASGLSGHRQLSHSAIAKPNTPDEHVLAEALESTLDSLGEHRELIATLQLNMAAIDTRLDSFQRSLTPPDGHNPPSLALISAWESCPDCGPKWIELKEVLWQRLHDEKLAALKALAEHSEDENPEHSEQVDVAQPQRWLIVLPYKVQLGLSPSDLGYKCGFEWSDKRNSLPGLPDGIKGYCKVTSDKAEVEKYSGEPDVQVIELPNPDGELRPAWLIMTPGGGHHGFKWDEKRGKYCLVVWDEQVAEEWAKKRGFEVVEIAGSLLEEYEQAHPLGV